MLLGDATEKEKEELFLSEESETMLQRSWEQSPGKSSEANTFKKDKVFQSIQKQINPVMTGHKTVTRRFFTPRVAAIFIIGFLGLTGALYLGVLRDQLKLKNTVLEVCEVGTAGKSVTLPDGSLVQMKENSSLSYPKKFKRKEREVYFSGEAFFDVTENPSKPFLVKTSSLVIEVLGTTFNVRAFDEEGVLETTLYTGKVKISRTNPRTKKTQSVVLSPNHKASFYLDQERFIMDRLDQEKQEQGTGPSLRFDNESLQAIVLKMEGHFGVRIILGDERVGKFKLTMQIDNESLDEILTIIDKTLPVEILREKGEIRITSSE